ncbi:hypothetical protein ANN_23930 [Periplaneta americana]|uniref:Uncharacterized protein n=1 Tax=Periplaneta americana TaxID=6978 RepID=A0ABQ8S2C8_PERAM|nr:hypothetical protein ANN_23930 [Periplaneta americana]
MEINNVYCEMKIVDDLNGYNVFLVSRFESVKRVQKEFRPLIVCNGRNKAQLTLVLLPQLIVYADDVNMLGENPQTFRENAEILPEAVRKNSPQYMFRNSSHSCHYRRYRTYRFFDSRLDDKSFSTE